MKEQFDKKLVYKIKASFDDHKEEFDPRQWEKFSSTYFSPKSGGYSAPYLYWAAASVVALLGLSLLFYQMDFDSSEERHVLVTNQEVDSPQLSKTPSNGEENSRGELKEENIEGTSKSDNFSKTPPNIPPRKVSSKLNKETPQERGHLVDRYNSSEIPDQWRPEISVATGENEYHESNVVERLQIAEREAEEKLVAQIQKINEENEALAAIKEWLGEDDSKIMDKDAEISNPIRLGLLVIPQTTTSSNQAMNLGAGVMSEFSLSKKFKIDLGLAYAAQNLSPSAGKGMMATADAATARSATFTNNFINTTSVLSFGQLEIPLNLKYKVMDKATSGIYLMSGISNMFYLNQQNVITYNTANIQTVGLMSNNAMVQSFTETQTPNSTSDGGNMGQLINFGFGYERNLSSGTFISIEPFYKMSIGDQTFINQQFSIGGINLRMNFQIKNK